MCVWGACVLLSIHPSIHPPIHPSVHPPTHPSIHPSIHVCVIIYEFATVPVGYGYNTSLLQANVVDSCSQTACRNAGAALISNKLTWLGGQKSEFLWNQRRGSKVFEFKMKYGDVWGAIVQFDSYIHIGTSYLASPKPCYSNSVSKLLLWPVSLLDFFGNKVYHVYHCKLPCASQTQIKSRHNDGRAATSCRRQRRRQLILGTETYRDHGDGVNRTSADDLINASVYSTSHWLDQIWSNEFKY